MIFVEILLKHFKPNKLMQLISHDKDDRFQHRNIFHWIGLRTTNAENEHESAKVMEYMSTITKNILNQRFLGFLLAHQDIV